MRKFRTASLVILTILVFGISYYICITKIKDYDATKNMYQVKTKNYNSIRTNSNIDDVMAKDGNLVFKIKYAKSGDIQIEKEKSVGKLAGKTKSEIEDMYKSYGYKVDSFNPLETVLIKEVNRYEPDKYVVGIKNGAIAIYKTDKNGNMFIEDSARDITDIKVNKLRPKDIELLTKGDKYFQCDTLEDAEARLEDYE